MSPNTLLSGLMQHLSKSAHFLVFSGCRLLGVIDQEQVGFFLLYFYLLVLLYHLSYYILLRWCPFLLSLTQSCASKELIIRHRLFFKVTVLIEYWLLPWEWRYHMTGLTEFWILLRASMWVEWETSFFDLWEERLVILLICRWERPDLCELLLVLKFIY